jgi:trehalose 6-phosphate synthase/phosphatase
MRRRLSDYDVVCWGNEFLRRLGQIKNEQQSLSVRVLSPGIFRNLLKDYRNASKRLLLLDYNGTLVPPVRHPQLASRVKHYSGSPASYLMT